MKQGVPSKTAELGAMIRAVATKNEFGKSVFYDPYSKYFVGSRTIIPYFLNRLTSIINPSFWRYGMNSIGFLLSLCRHRFVFDQLKSSLENGVEQIVIIGAGYDTSFLILKDQLRDKILIEIDHPATQRRKEKIIQAKFEQSQNIALIPVDLDKKLISGILNNRLLDKKLSTLIIIEGVLSYLSEDKISNLIKDLKGISSNIRLVADYRKKQLNESSNTLAKKWIRNFKKINEKYISFFSSDEIEKILSDEGYKIEQNIDLFELWLRYSKLKPNYKLKNFGGLFIASYGKK